MTQTTPTIGDRDVPPSRGPGRARSRAAAGATAPAPTSGVDVLDSLIDGVRVGDNLVVMVGADVPDRWLVDRFAAASHPDRLVIADAVGRHGAGERADSVLDWSQGATGPVRARAELAAADERVGSDAAFAFDSLSALAAAWGDQAALDLFLWACPRLYRRRSIALWLVDLDRHDETFVRRLTEITQVVVTVRGTAAGVRLEVTKADGRAGAVRSRTVDARLVDGDLVGARPAAAERQRLGATLRGLRTSRGLGQADLARRVGISPSALSQAERGVTGVSAETLIRIWEALGVPFGPEDPLRRGYRIHRRSGRPTAALAPGVSGRRLSDDPAVWHLSFDPRAAGRSALFPVKATETVTVQRGVLQLDVDGRTETLHEGDTLVADESAIAAWTNPADTGSDVIWIITG